MKKKVTGSFFYAMFSNMETPGARKCEKCALPYSITAADLNFYKRISPKIAGEVYDVPPPRLCPDCRKQRRLCFRNERNLFARICEACGKRMLSVYSPDRECKVFCQECWLEDKWEGIDYGLEPNLSGAFLDQFEELLKRVPLRSLFTVNNENSKYTNLCGMNKNCYLVFNCMENEDGYYLRGVARSRDCLDLYFGTHNELCYECINIHNCYNLFFSENCYQCHDSRFLYNCTGCSDCFCCTNLKSKKYHYFNEDLGKTEYQKKIQEISSSHSGLQKTKKDFDVLIGESVHRASQNLNAEDCTGDYLTNCKSCFNCFETHNSEGCGHSDCIKFAKDVYDCFGAALYSELQYEAVAVARSQKTCFCFNSLGCDEVYYSVFCDQCRHVFGCVGLKHKEYCVLNKQYSKSEYEELVPKIIRHMEKTSEWGEFFPSRISPLGYNQTLANEYYPLEKNAILSGGFNWSDFQNPHPTVKQIVDAVELPDSILDVGEELSHIGIKCEITGRPFRVIPNELDFLKRFELSLPRRHPDQRYLERLDRRNPHRLWKRSCDQCSLEIESSYSPHRSEVVYCEDCYRKAVY